MEMQHHLLPPGSLEGKKKKKTKTTRCGDLPSITGRSEKCERKLPESTVVSWGHTERSHEGIQPLYSHGFFQGNSFHDTSCRWLKEQLGWIHLTVHHTNLERPWDINFRACIAIMFLQPASLPGAACNSEIHISCRICCITLKRKAVILFRCAFSQSN